MKWSGPRSPLGSIVSILSELREIANFQNAKTIGNNHTLPATQPRRRIEILTIYQFFTV
jgi:hypothetical protein